MINAILAVVGLFLLYFCWSVSLVTWRRLAELGVVHERSSATYFDNVLRGALIGGVIARIVWMVTHLSLYAEVPWGVLPYSRSATEFVWFTVFPWRFFRVTEGITFPVMWVIMGILLVVSVFLPTVKLARTLRLEKRGIMRSFIVRNVICAMVTIGYFGVLTYFAW